MKNSKHISELTEIDKLVFTDTNLSSFIDLYEKIGIELDILEWDKKGSNVRYFIEMEYDDGYFYGDGRTSVNFDKNGKFVSQEFS